VAANPPRRSTKTREKLMAKQRNIYTKYYDHKRECIKVNCAAHVGSAVMRIVYHMQVGTYNAWSAEVFDNELGTLHVVVRRTNDTLRIVYRHTILEVGDHSNVIDFVKQSR
jgi:hypothetical protein